MLKRISWYVNGMLLGGKESCLSGYCQDKNCKEVHIPKCELQCYVVQSHCKLVKCLFSSTAQLMHHLSLKEGEVKSLGQCWPKHWRELITIHLPLIWSRCVFCLENSAGFCTLMQW